MSFVIKHKIHNGVVEAKNEIIFIRPLALEGVLCFVL